MSNMDDKIRQSINESLKEGFVFKGLNFVQKCVDNYRSGKK